MVLKLELPVIKKDCGECSACCIIPSFMEMNKPMYEPCRYICGQGYGCSIYADRPHTCQVYTCLWKVDQIEGDERRRPDKLGLMFVGSSTSTRIGGQFIIAWETRENAYQEEAARYAVRKIAETTLVLIRYYKSKKAIAVGPIPIVRLFNEMYPDINDDVDAKSVIYRHL